VLSPQELIKRVCARLNGEDGEPRHAVRRRDTACPHAEAKLLTGYRTRVGGRLRTLIYNHGGLGGLSGVDFDFCRTMAKAGWRVLSRLLGAESYFLNDVGGLLARGPDVAQDRDAMECAGQSLAWSLGSLPVTWRGARPYFLLYRNKAPDRQVPEEDPPFIGYNAHGSASFVTRFDPATMMSMDRPVHSFIHALFGADHSY